jgi:hypothetical protein
MIKLKELIPISEGLKYHIDNKIPIMENIYRYSSQKFLELFEECRTLYFENKAEFCEKDIDLIENTDIGKYGLYEGQKVPLDMPMTEAEYQGKDVQIGKPKRGGSGGKKFYVYVIDPKTKNVKKVSFGAAGGGGSLAVKLDNPKRRKAFSDRHNCGDKKDRTSPGYWACRVTRYWKTLGGSKNYPGYW